MRLRSMFTLLVTAGTLAACALNSPMPRAPVTSRTPVPESKPATPVTVGANQYLVQKGDTLYNISRKFGIPVQKLAELNQLQAPYGIYVGQVLNISSKSANSSNGNKPNDTSNASDDAEVVTSAISRPGLGASEDAAGTATTSPATSVATDSAKPANNGQQNIENVADTDIQWQWPLAGKISTGFDPQTNKGLNIAGTAGQTVTAAGAGKVIYSGMDVRGYGKLIIVKHNNNLLSVYAHQGNSLVKEGTFVNQGDKLAVLPAASDGKPPALHFEIRQKGKPVDPVGYLPNTTATETSGNS